MGSLIFSAGPAPAGEIWPIADTTQGYSSISIPTVNSSGTVAFNATTTGTAKIYTGTRSAVALALDPATVGLSSLYDVPSINNAGQIGFSATGPSVIYGTATNAYRLDPGGAVTRIYDGGGKMEVTTTIAPDSNVVYFTWRESMISAEGAGSGSGGTPTILISTMGGGYYHALGRLGVGASGQWVVNASDNAASSASGKWVVANGVVAMDWNAPTIYLPDEHYTVHLDSFGYSDISADGTIVVSGSDPLMGSNLYSYNGSTMTKLRTGQAIPAINENGIIAALFTSGTKSIYAGAGTPSNKIIAVGDALAGSTVTDLSFAQDGLAEGPDNYLVFRATLADGRTGVFETTVPEPGMIGVLGIAMLMLARQRRR